MAEENRKTTLPGDIKLSKTALSESKLKSQTPNSRAAIGLRFQSWLTIRCEGGAFRTQRNFTVAKGRCANVCKRRSGALRRLARAAGPSVWFLLKCLLVLAVIFVVASRERRPAAQGAAQPRVESARRAAPRAPHQGDAIETLRRAAAQKLVDGVKEQCLKRPEDCLSAVKSVGAGLSALDKAR